MTGIRLIIFDLDGTLFRGQTPIPGAANTVEELRKKGYLVRFLTNNSSTHRTKLVAKLKGMGFGVDDHEMYSSAIGAGLLLREKGLRSAFVVGEEGLEQTLGEFGIRVGRDAEAVVAGICRGLTYDWLRQAMEEIQGGAAFFATNTDATYPVEGGVQPGGGATVGAIVGCTGIQPIVVGKPEPFLIELILKEADISNSETLVVGDRPETDLEAARRAGCQALHVLTGVSTRPGPDFSSVTDVTFVLDYLA